MYSAQCRIRGITPLLQHRLSPETQAKMEQRGKKSTAAPDWTQEWRQALYHDPDSGIVYQPSESILQAMIKAAGNIQVPGKGKKTYKDFIKSFVVI